MKTFTLLFSMLFILSAFLLDTANAQLSSGNSFRAPFISATNTQQSMQSVMQNSEKDIVFIENLGQIRDSKGNKRPDVLFLTRSQGVDMYITSTGITYVFRKTDGDIKDKDITKDAMPKSDGRQVKSSLYRLDMEFVGINKNIKIKKELAVEQQFNYYTPEYPNGISPKAYKKITIENIYDGIDLVYYEKEGKMKYDFFVKTGADPDKIKMKYKGAEKLYLDKDGSVIVTTSLGEIIEEKPYTYYRSTGTEIENGYKVKDNVAQFDIAEYNKSKDIIIDPYIGATYYGGNDDDYGNSITTDSNNNILITGYTYSTNFPIKNPGGSTYFQGSYGGGIFDVFILKFTSSGIRQWVTYYGGNGFDNATSITTDGNNNILIAGYTQSLDFPIQNPGGGAYFQNAINGATDAFILKFNLSGVRLWATYYGGSRMDEGNSITTDGNDNILITGETFSLDLPLYNPSGGAYYQSTFAGGTRDAFILKFDSNCIRKWATYYGGGGFDNATCVITDGNNNISVTGCTYSPDFPVQNPGGGAYFQGTLVGSYDIFIMKFNLSGVRQWATYYGGSDHDEGYSITTDGNNNILVTGRTNSTNFPVQNPGGGAYFQDTLLGYMDVFMLKFNQNYFRQWATYYGGSGHDEGYSITTNENNNILVTGFTSSTDLPLQDPGGGAYFQDTNAGNFDVYILRLNSSNVHQWSTYYGGLSSDYGFSITTDGNSNILVTGCTKSTNFPLYAPGGGAYFQGMNAGDNDVFILGFMPSGVIISIHNINTIVPDAQALYQNYPNPFNLKTNIRFDLYKTSHAKLIVYNMLGKEITTLVNDNLKAGCYEVNWDATGYPSSVYFYKLITDEFVDTKKMMIIK